MLYNLFSRRKKRAAAPAAAPPAPEAVDATMPTAAPIVEPVVEPVGEPAVEPTGDASTDAPTPTPTPTATATATETSADAVAEPVDEPVDEPVVEPGIVPTSESDAAGGDASEVAAVPADSTDAVSESDTADEAIFVPERPEMEDVTAVELTALTVPMLRLRAREVGVTGYSRMKKSELIAAITAKGAE
jgi:hypothetical protein